MISLVQIIISFLFILIFSLGCISIGYVVFGAILDKMAKRSGFLSLGDEMTEVSEITPFIKKGIDRLPAPNLQTFESLLITMDTLNSCLESPAMEALSKSNSTKLDK